MEPRKIIKFGNSSYVITLPYEWLKRNNIDKGDSINLTENKSNIILSVNKEKEYKSAEISFDGKPIKLFNRELISYYLKNYKFIKIYGKNCIDKIEEIRILKEKLSSIEIVEINTDYIILKDLSNPSELEIFGLINEIIEMEKILFAELKKNNRENKQYFISQLDTNINKLSFLAYKAINYNLSVWENPENIKSVIQHHRIVSAFETIGDILKRIARYLKDAKEEHIHHINITLESLENYFSYIVALLKPNINLDKNLALYMDKKQSLLREVEFMRENLREDLNLYLVIAQLLKDVVGQLDTIIISVIDLNKE